MSASEITELVGFLTQSKPQVRLVAAKNVFRLTSTEEGKAALRQTDAAFRLAKLVGDLGAISRVAIGALINLSDDAVIFQQMLQLRIVSMLMENLSDPECTTQRLSVMLLCNLSQTTAGCLQVLQLDERGGALKGLHVRKLIQWFVRPVSGDEDPFEYAGQILHNVTQIRDARHIILDRERGIFPALLPQLQAKSEIRRRGVAGIIRNCCFEADKIPYMMTRGVKLPEKILVSLSGPESYTEEEKGSLPEGCYSSGASKRREEDPPTRRYLLESLVLLASHRESRIALRDMQTYAVLRYLHMDMEPSRVQPDGAAPFSGWDGGMVGSKRPDDPDTDTSDDELDPDDRKTIEAILTVVDYMLRDEQQIDEAAANRPRMEVDNSDVNPDDLKPSVTRELEAEAEESARRVEEQRTKDREATTRERSAGAAVPVEDEAEEAVDLDDAAGSFFDDLLADDDVGAVKVSPAAAAAGAVDDEAELAAAKLRRMQIEEQQKKLRGEAYDPILAEAAERIAAGAEEMDKID